MSGDRRLGLNVHVYPSPFEYESRILKVTKSLVDRAIVQRVIIVATAKEGLPASVQIDRERRVLRVATALRGDRLVAKVARFVEWSARVFLALRREPVAMVNCHSLSVFPLCVWLAWWHRCHLVYEPHELETETVTMTGVRRPVAKWLERMLIGRADIVIAVSDSIAGHYRRDYGLSEVHVILNVPEAQAAELGVASRQLRDAFRIPGDHLVFLYQGSLEEARGVAWLLEAFRLVPRDRHLVFMGFGPLEGTIRDAAAAEPNLHLQPAVPPGEIMPFTRSADVGIAPLTDDCLNHRCALPNKLFEYIHAGLPVIVSDLEEMRNLVERYDCGWTVANDARALADLVSAMDRAAVDARRAGASRARNDLRWDREADKLEAIYQQLPLRAATRHASRLAA